MRNLTHTTVVVPVKGTTMKIETDDERADIHALADLLVHGLPESQPAPITDDKPTYAPVTSTLSLLKNMSELMHTRRLTTPTMFPGAPIIKIKTPK